MKSASASASSSSALGSVSWATPAYHQTESLTRAKDDGEEDDSSFDDFNADSPEDDNDNDYDDANDGDNDDDADYAEPSVRRTRTQLGPGQPKQSPASRGGRKSSVATAAKSRVRKADPNGAICLLTNLPAPTRFLQFCHVLARATNDETLKRLEYWWQNPYYTLYIDSHYNILVLQSTFHNSMDSGDWALVPHHKLITQLEHWVDLVVSEDPTGYNPTNRVPISQLYKDKVQFIYFFLALNDQMKYAAISRFPEKADPDNLVTFDPLAFESYSYPTYSTDVGELVSHIRPNFVVYAVGQKLDQIRNNMVNEDYNEYLDSLAEIACFGHEATETQSVKQLNRNSLRQIVKIYDAWSSSKHVPTPTDPRSAGWLYHPDAPECKDLEEPEGWPTL
ncbi:hypothetical protein C8R47DRAFT_1227795 [Mycena vitilis]|nr:hypothetical protein C8R47DRAFT_1227795 [Mycena vitilis]